VTLNATPVNGGISPVYQWYRNSYPISAATSQVYIFTTNNSDNGELVYCVLTSSDCVLPKKDTSNIITLTIIPTPHPQVSYSVSPGTSICSDIPVTCTATDVNGGTSPVYDWYQNSSNV